MPAPAAHLTSLLICTQPAEQLTVMADDHHAPLELIQCITQGVNALHVQVVGGFVKQQDVWIAQGNGSEHNARLLATCKPAAAVRSEGGSPKLKECIAGRHVQACPVLA